MSTESATIETTSETTNPPVINDIEYERFYKEDIELIKAVPIETIFRPSMPVDIYLSEAESLLEVLDRSIEQLKQRGFDAAHKELLLRRVGAGRVAQSAMQISHSEIENTRDLWKHLMPEASALHNELLDDLRFACNDDEEKYSILKEITKGATISDMTQDLLNLAKLGEMLIPELKKISVDITKLQKAKKLSSELERAHTAANLDRSLNSEARTIRDQAITLLNESVVEIRRWAKYVFKNDPKMLNHFLSKHLRNKHKKYVKDQKDEVAAESSTGAGYD